MPSTGSPTRASQTVRDRGIWVMHPGPVNRGVELTDEVMTYERCLINDQVENGIATRMAILYWLKPETDFRDDRDSSKTLKIAAGGPEGTGRGGRARSRTGKSARVGSRGSTCAGGARS